MRPGYELVKEQLFFRRELKERVSWFIRLRWVAAGLGLGLSWSARFAGLDLPVGPLTGIFLLVILYNGVFYLVCRRLESFKPEDVRPFTIFAHIQISLDLLALFLVIFFTGGTTSPFVIFTIFHIVLAGILLPPAASFVYAGIVLLAMAGLIMAQRVWLHPAQTSHGLALFQAGGNLAAWIHYLAFAGALLITAFLTTSLKKSLRIKGRHLLAISKELDGANAQLTALYRMIKEVSSHSELQPLLDAATSQATRIMGVKGCSIKLLDEQKRELRFASTHGLSQDYLSKEAIDLEKSSVSRKIIQGFPYVIRDIQEKDYVQYPEDIQKEGIASMLCLPLRANNTVLGVFCVYSSEISPYEREDMEFFGLMSDLTAIAIERLKWDLTKSWFMTKAAHQLRSPLNAIHSMLRMVRRGYLGSLNDKQNETLERCEKRLEILAELINDLLKVGRERTEAGKTKLHPVDPAEVMNQLVPLYQNQSLQKGLDISFHIHEPVPHIVANERLLEDLYTNLISNAIKYTPAGGRIQVELAGEDHKKLRFEVSDTGIGIPEENIPRLFSEFFRGENAKALVEEGTGLGLVIVKEILDRLGGRIQVESKVGEGTRLTCLIPAMRQS
jgi:signal transduction histidine kinase